MARALKDDGAIRYSFVDSKGFTVVSLTDADDPSYEKLYSVKTMAELEKLVPEAAMNRAQRQHSRPSGTPMVHKRRQIKDTRDKRRGGGGGGANKHQRVEVDHQDRDQGYSRGGGGGGSGGSDRERQSQSNGDSPWPALSRGGRGGGSHYRGSQGHGRGERSKAGSQRGGGGSHKSSSSSSSTKTMMEVSDLPVADPIRAVSTWADQVTAAE